MKIEEYQALAANTLPRLGSSEKDFAHMAMGVVSEFGELEDSYKDRVNFMEELGDMTWYLAGICTLLLKKSFSNLSRGVEPMKDDGDEYRSIYILADLAKAHLAYGKKMDLNQIEEHVKNILSFIKLMCELKQEVDFREVLEKNIAKLKVRYPDKFDADKALDRDLEAERKALES